MTLTVDQLYKAHAKLQTKWEGVVDFKDVSELDHFYSDGMSKDAILKIVLRHPNDAECIRVVYIFPDGGYSEVFEQPINRMILTWIASVL